MYKSNDLECMGTVFRFTFPAEVSALAESLLPVGHQLLIEADQTFSTYKPNSEISRIARGELELSAASVEVRQAFADCLSWNQITGGAFDANNGEFWDPSGLVKALATQSVVEFFEANGLRNFTINAGGDIVLGSEVEDQLLSRVGIANAKSIAAEDFSPLTGVDLAGTNFRAVATSGNAERGEHIWNSTKEFLQVSVVARDLISADVWATAIYSGGAKTLALLPAEFECLVVTRDGQIQKTAGFGAIELELARS